MEDGTYLEDFAQQQVPGNLVLVYLREISNVIEILGCQQQPEKEPRREDSCEQYIDKLSRNLLFNVCRPDIISASVPKSLLLKNNSNEAINSFDQTKRDDDIDSDDDVTNESEVSESQNIESSFDDNKLYRSQHIRRRIDALRSTLRLMAPIAMDVAICVTSIALSSVESEELGDDSKNNKQIPESIKASAFILFGTWLPIAPQLGPIVLQLFSTHSFTSPFACYSFSEKENNSNECDKETDMDIDEDGITYEENGRKSLKTRMLISEAAHHICDFFSKRGESEQMKNWWNWSGLFSLLGSSSDRISLQNQKEKILDANENDIIIAISKEAGWSNRNYDEALAIKWHSARAICCLLNIRNYCRLSYLKKAGVDEEMVPWVPHPWHLIEEEECFQNSQLTGVVRLIKDGEYFKVPLPSSDLIRKVLPIHSALVDLGKGIVLPQYNIIQFFSDRKAIKQPTSNDATCRMDIDISTKSDIDKDNNLTKQKEQKLILTETTARNLSLIGLAMNSDPHPPPILVCGPRGSGKSSLVRELVQYCSAGCYESNNENAHSKSYVDNLLELHVDDETDSKTLLGSYVATDIPGEFTWRPGALTIAVRTGKWVLLEDVESCPLEVQAALVKLFEERILPLGIGKNEKCHPNFRLFGTCTTNYSGAVSGIDDTRRLHRGVITAGVSGKKILHPYLWRRVHADPLPFNEIQYITRHIFPSLPAYVSKSALRIFRLLDTSGRTEDATEATASPSAIIQSDDMEVDKTNSSHGDRDSSPGVNIKSSNGWRHSSVRDYMKMLARISNNVNFETGVSYVTETQRMLCFAETIDIFAASCPSNELRRSFINLIAAPTWEVSVDFALQYVEKRCPPIRFAQEFLEVGRARLDIALNTNSNTFKDTVESNFAETNHALRLMETVAVCIVQNEPALLVGETGCGKTTLIQRLAKSTGRELVVQNLSLQTDSTDILGGYRPLEIRHIARKIYGYFIDIFVSTFSRVQNDQFLNYVATAFGKGQWKRLSQCFRRASKMGLNKMKEIDKRNRCLPSEGNRKFSSKDSMDTRNRWSTFVSLAERFERQRIASESGLAFVFAEGALVDAIRTGKWVLLDEINLASSETLQRLCGLLDDSRGSVTLTERGDSKPLKRHPDFRLFAAMNPATDAGKKDLPQSIRARFTEIYVDELVDPIELRSVAARYLSGAINIHDSSLCHSESVVTAVDVYLQCRKMSEDVLVDGSGHKPRYTLRTLCRSLSAAKNLIVQQNFSPKRAILESFQLAFDGALDSSSRLTLGKLLTNSLGQGLSKKDLDHPARRPGRKKEGEDFVLIKPFWIKRGQLDCIDWAEINKKSGKSRFIVTDSASKNLRRLARAVSAGPWPVLLEGPTSAGKTTLVEYLAARSGQRCIRINNHEHTDVQEYTGSYATDSDGKLCFKEGLLVQALKQGHWVILDELNLAPSEVLEALNRLLDDNRELYIPETNETVKPHQNFRLFATQNPCGAYGGRKPLSKAFRNRFVEMHVDNIPANEMVRILELRCGCPPSHAKILVNVMNKLRQRRSKSGVFRGKDGLITPRDLLRWAERDVSTKSELAMEGYMLLAERLRCNDEKDIVRSTIETELKIKIDCDSVYYGSDSEARKQLNMLNEFATDFESAGLTLQAIAPTKSLLRLLTLVQRCVRQKEPILLVGDTGCGKTTVVQLLSVILKIKLHIVNCHASTETSDLLGGLRPLRGRNTLLTQIIERAREFILIFPFDAHDLSIPSFLNGDKSASSRLPSDAVQVSISLLRKLWSIFQKLKENTAKTTTEDESVKRERKRRKLDKHESVNLDTNPKLFHQSEQLGKILSDVEALSRQYHSLFEWADGPLVEAMKQGHLLLLDEMSLAEDAVLERLNSILEPSRTLVLAEKGGNTEGGEDYTNTVIKAEDNFRIFATMNPGGDFGKRELSPALRSRFTEIWVPAVTDRNDIDLVLERTLSFAIENRLVPGHPLERSYKIIHCGMLDYIEWFNKSVCAGPSSPCTEFTLSLRDVLAWAHFIVDVCTKKEQTDLWVSYLHGALLMHLDGLGLGTTLSQTDASNVKFTAQSFLKKQVSNQCTKTRFENIVSDVDSPNYSYVHSEGSFGILPFFISTGNELIPKDLEFELKAPTTFSNMRRVLRAMQIAKPILLEGSPGVGKTSLISALAKASGHKLIRINLSEQTDITDLMGSDLPVPSDDGDTGGASFKWCDGVFLKAIQRGDWVLLDELNLASQTVLEGLNSCLDHRSSVFIPELGQTFKCPSSFKIFAAQNPLAQGGGRKGLPKSFLNRFTKVFIEALTPKDLRIIVETKFPSLKSTFVDQMLTFNSAIQQDVMDNRLYGQAGSPWEFNLRDVFRWCQLMVKNNHSYDNYFSTSFVDTLYFQRLRTLSDRNMLLKRYSESFGNQKLEEYPPFRIDDKSVNIGHVSLPRDNSNLSSFYKANLHGTSFSIMKSLARPMQAVAHCVNMNWPCLLVGESSSGKSSILRILSDSCNMHLEEVALTSSTDVTELIGCFEQADSSELKTNLTHYLEDIYLVACQVLVKNGVQMTWLERISVKYWKWLEKDSVTPEQSISSIEADEQNLLVDASSFVDTVVKVAAEIDDFRFICGEHITNAEKTIKILTQSINLKSNKNKNLNFNWVDGVLVKAMENGSWLHLENVNFCSSSVLDRLNPLMESGGDLIMTECGTNSNTDDVEPRIVRPHPSFRLFLSMNPSSGEISRAMRNRCVEVSLIPPIGSNYGKMSSNASSESFEVSANSDALDSLDSLGGTGLRSPKIQKAILSLHANECIEADRFGLDCPTTKQLKEWGELFVSASKRGYMVDLAFFQTFQISYELHENDSNKRPSMITAKNILNSTPETGLHAVNLSTMCDIQPIYANINMDARLIKAIRIGNSNILLGLNRKKEDGNCDNKQLIIRNFCPLFSRTDQRLELVQPYLVAKYVLKSSRKDILQRSSFIDGFCDELAAQVKFMLKTCFNAFFDVGVKNIKRFVSLNNGDELFSISQSKSLEVNGSQYDEEFQVANDQSVRIYQLYDVLCKDRLVQLFDEYILRTRILRQNVDTINTSEISIMAASICIHEGKADRNLTNCPVTPILSPLFESFDALIIVWKKVLYNNLNISTETILGSVGRLLVARDRLWNCLCDIPSNSDMTSFGSLREAGFVIHWIWFKKRLNEFYNIFFDSVNDAVASTLRQQKKNLDLLIASIDQPIFETTGDVRLLSDSVWKRCGHPQVPAAADDWLCIQNLRNLSKSFSFLEGENFGLSSSDGNSRFQTISMQGLIDSNHPSLFIGHGLKEEILGALCMMQWSTTDELVGMPRTESKNFQGTKTLKLISDKINDSKCNYLVKMKSLVVDKQINTVENSLSIEDLDKMKMQMSLNNNDEENEGLIKRLLRRFGLIQAMQLSEFWCVKEELGIIEDISRIMVMSNQVDVVGEVQKILPRIKRFISVVITDTELPVDSLRPYRTIIWAADCGSFSKDSFRHLFRCVFPLLIADFVQHCWCNSFNDMDIVSESLISPSIFGTNMDKRKENYDELDTSLNSMATYKGPARLYQPIRSAALFRILGYSTGVKLNHKIPHVTLENWQARRIQSEYLIDHLCKNSISGNRYLEFFVIGHMLLNVFEALEDYCEDNKIQIMLQQFILGDSAHTPKTLVAYIIKYCSHSVIQSNCERIIKPLLTSIQKIKLSQKKDKQYEKYLSSAWIYVGILRFHLLVPTTPIDPGLRPAAKVLQWDTYLVQLSSRITANRLEYGVEVGNFFPNNQETEVLLHKHKYATKKREKQAKKRVERPHSARPFPQLFQEIRHFAKTVANIESILDLSKHIESRHDENELDSIYRQEINWQSSVNAFCARISLNYSHYEDVISHILAAIRSVQYGLRCGIYSKLNEISTSKTDVAHIQDQLLHFPFGYSFPQCNQLALDQIFKAFKECATNLDKVVDHSKAARRCQLHLLLSSLSRIQSQISGRFCRHEHKQMREASSIISLLIHNFCKKEDNIESDHQTIDKITTEEEREEEIFREQFPDHNREFQLIIDTVEMGGDDSDDDENNINNDGLVLEEEHFSFTNDQLSLLCRLHSSIFSGKRCIQNNKSNIQYFLLAYETASKLNYATGKTRSTTDKYKRVADFFCIGLNTMGTDGKFSSIDFKMDMSETKCRDFHYDPFPNEVVKADKPLGRLLVRLNQLLNAFPGHSILLVVGRITERIRQMDLREVSLGKILTGLEVILRKAQEWEQHASSRVAIGEPLKEISKLVADWRRLELQSWAELLDLRSRRHIPRAHRHWMKVYFLITNFLREQKETSIRRQKQGGDSSFESVRPKNRQPKWIWKGLKESLCNINAINVSDGNEHQLIDLIKAMDTFLLTSTIGEFSERMKILNSFANQLRLGLAETFEETDMSLLFACSLKSLCHHYSRLETIVTTTRSKLRKPIEQRLKDEVKLSKWDEQSYYSLAESSEKSHRKLIKFLKEYDDVLETPVSKIFEENFLYGIRSNSEANSEAQCNVETSVPSNSLIFPHEKDTEGLSIHDKTTKGLIGNSLVNLRSKNRRWTEIPKDEKKIDKFITNMQLYHKKILSYLHEENLSTCFSHGNQGFEMSSSFCDTVFDRLNSLRNNKVTKSMKQRALVDFFKALKKHGYSSMKWSVPEQCREMNHILQVPVPMKEGLMPNDLQNLDSAESYFQRCNIEISRLRSEILMVGSQFMSQREMMLMIGYSEHGLLMLCQQRSMLTHIISEIQSIHFVLNQFDQLKGKVPKHQKSLSNAEIHFLDSYCTTMDTLQQLILILKTTYPLVKGEEQSMTLRDLISVVDSTVSNLLNLCPSNKNSLLISNGTIEKVDSIGDALLALKLDISSFAKRCEEDHCIPQELLESCFVQIDLTYSHAKDFHDLFFTERNGTCKDNQDGFLSIVSSTVQNALLSTQVLNKQFSGSLDFKSKSKVLKSDEQLWNIHMKCMKEWDHTNLSGIKNNFSQIYEGLQRMENLAVSKNDWTLYLQLSQDICALFVPIIDSCNAILSDLLKFYRNVGKFEYIMLRVFRMLVAKGFCDAETNDGGEGEGEGDINNMKFDDDVDGTGMGEGEGKKDVTDQIENEEQLLGLQGDNDNEKNDQQDRELNEEEADQGMEMEADFDGDMYDVPENKNQEEDNEDEGNEEELDREMGDNPDPNEEVIDEKMWDEDDEDSNEKDNEETEKFEKDSKVTGTSEENELRTKEDDNDKQENGEQKEDTKPNNNDVDEDQDNNDADVSNDDPINDDFEENYEDRHEGVDIRQEEQDDASDDENLDQNDVEFGDGLDLDDNDENNENDDQDVTGVEDNMDIEGAEGDEEVEDDINMSEEEDSGLDESEANPTSTQIGGEEVDQNNEDDDEGEENDEGNFDLDLHKPQNSRENEAHGVAAKNGQDSVKKQEEKEEEKDDDNERKDDDKGDENENQGNNQDDENSAMDVGEGDNDDGEGNWQDGEGNEGNAPPGQKSLDLPNPFRDPGDAEKFWHKKLRMKDDSIEEDHTENEADDGSNNEDENVNTNGMFEFVSKSQSSSAQVLGEAPEIAEETMEVKEDENDTPDENDSISESNKEPAEAEKDAVEKKVEQDRNKKTKTENSKGQPERKYEELQESTEEDFDEKLLKDEQNKDEKDEDEQKNNQNDVENRIVTDISQLQVQDDLNLHGNNEDIIDSDVVTSFNNAETLQARQRWSKIQSETNNLSRRLCEKLRLVMEPLVATKLRGDYRTGKRINMKRVIGYIASGYRKDKIWLRRTKPAKRNYRVLLAVDDSESMKKSGAGDMALLALATLANGMSQLEVGELGIASFGEDMKLLHPFNLPFTSESGANIVRNFKFNDQRTRTSLCVESAIMALESQSESSGSLQLVFIISDGRIERDSRQKLRKLVREMSERNILIVMIIVEGTNGGDSQNKDSIVHMKEVSFEKGKPKIKHFIDDYPFPYYMVLEDMSSLPEVLGDALRQWFEMVSQIQSTNSS